jgi:hypothetical protein
MRLEDNPKNNAGQDQPQDCRFLIVTRPKLLEKIMDRRISFYVTIDFRLKNGESQIKFFRNFTGDALSWPGRLETGLAFDYGQKNAPRKPAPISHEAKIPLHSP